MAKKQWSITGEERRFEKPSIALKFAQRKHPCVQWGDWHQSPNGFLQIIGYVVGCPDSIVIRYELS